jgi:Mn-containing catalase
MYVNTSQGDGDLDGPWNSGDQWDRIDDIEGSIPMDGGDGKAAVKLDKASAAVVAKLVKRTESDPTSDPATGADLGAGPGAGLITGEDKGGAKDIQSAADEARELV